MMAIPRGPKHLEGRVKFEDFEQLGYFHCAWCKTRHNVYTRIPVLQVILCDGCARNWIVKGYEIFKVVINYNDDE